MKRSLGSLLLLAALYLLPACSNDKKTEETKTEGKEVNDKAPITNDTPAAIAAQWCELNSQITKAAEADKEAARAKLKEFEKGLEDKYKNDENFMKEIEKEVEKCEDASEGR